jgi:pyruvate/2-oxoglutarate dehydrogenase complex dihydrolipoamide dehydrogenase (E3) component
VLISGPHYVRAEEAVGVQSAQSLSSEQLQHKHVPRVAVIGAGIGGASAAYFLNKLLDGQVNIHV